jgi:hypothetical protein
MAGKLKYIVEGGIFEDTTWTKVVDQPEFYGPFDTYPEAKLCWTSRSFTWKLDNCMHRLFIKEIMHYEN